MQAAAASVRFEEVYRRLHAPINTIEDLAAVEVRCLT